VGKPRKALIGRLALGLGLVIGGSGFGSGDPVRGLPARPCGEMLEVCFVPGSDCGARVAQAIDGARSAVRVQAYTFTSPRIAHALARARRRGVDVVALLDARESRLPNEAAAIRALVEAGVPVRFDGAHSTAHNKVLVIDRATVVTGSLNFSVSAERYSAENVLFVRNDPRVVQAFLDNFALHWAHSGAGR
jgi:phosphatidylserine/phosphatidylglycerophosphate/cardiolipin synthase-like enzyme